MAKKGLSGQLNMFDFFRGLEEAATGEVEMVSLIPEDEEPQPEAEEVPETEEEPKVKEETKDEEETKVEEVPQPKPNSHHKAENGLQVAMSRAVTDSNGDTTLIEYINYNKVRVTKSGEEPILHEFADSKEAVNYYVETMQSQMEQ